MTNKPCKLWNGRLNGSGYGTVWAGGKRIGVHRLAWEKAYGMEVPEGFHVCHHCDVRICHEPSHLFLGTRSDNMMDMTRKGRNRGALPENRPRGEAHRARVKAATPRGVEQAQAKLDDDKVREIRTRALSDRQFAAKFGVSIPTVHAARVGKTWSHVR